MRHLVAIQISVPNPEFNPNAEPPLPPENLPVTLYPPTLLDLLSIVAVEEAPLSEEAQRALDLWSAETHLDITSLPPCVARVHCSGISEPILLPHITSAEIHAMIVDSNGQIAEAQKQAQEIQMRRMAQIQAAQAAGRAQGVVIPNLRAR